jgi:ribosome-associated translation inhibitor RaiA
MKIHITPRHLRLTDAVESQTVSKFETLTHINDRIVSAHVTLANDDTVDPAMRFTASARLAVAGPDLFAEESAADLSSAVDAVTSLRKRKTAIGDKRRSAAQRASEQSRREA